MKKHPVYPRNPKITSDRGYNNIDDSSVGGSPLLCCRLKDNKSFYFDCFGGSLDKILPNQITKPLIYLNYKTQNKNSKLRGSYCLYFFYLIERMHYYNIFSKLYFDWFNMRMNVIRNSS